MPEDFPDDAHFKRVLSSIMKGLVVPFFGAGANMCGRPADPWRWGPNQEDYLPSGGELASHLEEQFILSLTDDERQLMRVSQYVDTFQGQGSLYYTLHELFDKPYPPTSLHRFFARLPSVLREKGYPKNTTDPVRRRFTIVTTNYDDLLERAFEKERQPYHVISYAKVVGREAEGVGKFLHWPPGGGGPIVIDNAFTGFNDDGPDPHPVVLKIHGAVHRPSAVGSLPSSEPGEGTPDADAEPQEHRVSYDSFVITEDHYIDYLLEKDIIGELPKGLSAKLQKSHFLFLGYKLRDWNLRAILRRIWIDQGPNRFNSWAIMKDCTVSERKYWDKHRLEAYNTDLNDYVVKLEEHLRNWPW